MLKITIFAKKRKTQDGKEFYSFISKLTKQDGSELTTTVKFSDCDAPKPSACPLNIEFDKTKANLDCKTVTAEDGTVYERNTLWIKEYIESSDNYIDHSLDEF